MTVYPPEKQFIVSVGISKTSYSEVVALCRQWAAERKHGARKAAHYICVTNVYGIMLAKDHPEIAKAFNEADIARPDGMPVVWRCARLVPPASSASTGPR